MNERNRAIWAYDLDDGLRDSRGWKEVRAFLKANDAYDDMIPVPSTVEVTEADDGTRWVGIKVYDEDLPLCPCGDSVLTHEVTRPVVTDLPTVGRHKGRRVTVEHAEDLLEAARKNLVQVTRRAVYRIQDAEDTLDRAKDAAARLADS